MNPDTDVLIVGYGPTGQTLAILLAQQGWNVTVMEKWDEPFTMPRAVSFDGESARILAAAGIGKHLTEFGEPSRDYVWRNAAGQTLLEIDVAEHGHCGWPDSTSMYQPGLEGALSARGEGLPVLRVRRGLRVVKLDDHGDRVSVRAENDAGQPVALTARWVVGCDGANSCVREAIGGTVTDLGFASEWLTCDVVLNQPRDFVPNNLQVCDPARPATAVSAGPGHRRWEFMRLPGEPLAQFRQEDTAWRLLAPFGVTPATATLRRYAMYRFQARYADQWRAGRLLIAGDAAHLMPPFAGQGMCSGFRDVANLAWKLDLVLRGVAAEPVLDTYTAERRAHVQHAIAMSVNLGKVICQPDPAAAADRDAVLLATRKRNGNRPQSEPAVYQPLTGGFRYRPGSASAGSASAGSASAGTLMPQGRVARGRVTGLLDEVAGRGFVLLASQDPRSSLDAEALGYLAGLGAHLIHVLPAGQRGDHDAVIDAGGTYTSYLNRTRAAAVLVRPDFYVFGGVSDHAGLPGLIEALRRELSGN